MASAMDTDHAPDREQAEPQNFHMHLDQRDGRTVIAVAGEDLQECDTAGWTLAARRPTTSHRDPQPPRATERTCTEQKPRQFPTSRNSRSTGEEPQLHAAKPRPPGSLGLRQARKPQQKRSNARRGSRTGRKASRSCERVKWSDVVMNPKQGTSPPKQHKTAMQALQEENAELKAEIRRLDQRLEEALRHLRNPPEQQREQPKAAATAPQPEWEQGRVPRPQSLTPRHQQPPQHTARNTGKSPAYLPSPTNEQACPQTRSKACTPPNLPRGEHGKNKTTNPPPPPPSLPTMRPNPRSTSGISSAVRLRMCTERIDRLEKRMDAFEHRVNGRFHHHRAPPGRAPRLPISQARP
ncbi:hypothetical protein HPB48_017796 [Haemaphysalis longicornis]|uniref:Uncharacterized protein n=1 Tax=Haemaphysalis longicornis TaxID=44386 RepID=A0A9J6FV05_HAELO|nr:hypothetical protein HPB48_017796 [Haemaphysalis longicornis]